MLALQKKAGYKNNDDDGDDGADDDDDMSKTIEKWL